MGLEKYQTMGRSGLHVSALCLGAMSFGAPGGADAADSHAIMDRFFDQGGNFIDTSNIYGRGESERIIGARLGSDPSRRTRTVLATKFSASATLGDPNSGGASRSAIIAACEGSLRRLRTDHIDLYLLHWQDPITPVDETMRALDDLVRAGKVRYIGFSDVPAWRVTHAQMLATMHDRTPLIALQIEYSLLQRTVEHDYVPMAADMGLGIMPWSPLGGGALTGKYRADGSVTGESARARTVGGRMDARAHTIVDELRRIAAEYEATPGQVALAWLRDRSGVTSPIVGPRTSEQLQESVGALSLTLSRDDILALDAISRPDRPFPHSIMRRVWGTSHGGLTINGRPYETSPATPKGENSLDRPEDRT